MKISAKVPKELQPLFEKAEEQVANLFKDFSSTPADGTISVSGDRYLLVRSSSLAYDFFDCIYNTYKDQGEEKAKQFAKKFLYTLANSIGKSDSAALISKLETKNKKNALTYLATGPIHFAYTGWAFVEILADSHPSPDQNYFLIYNHLYSFEADAWIRLGKKSNSPICVMNAGYSAGWCETCYGFPLIAIEIKCKACGDDCCQFIMAPPDKIEHYLKQYAEKQITADHVSGLDIPDFYDPERAREKLRMIAEKAQENEKKFLVLNDAAKDAIIVIDHMGRIIVWNKSAETLFGYTFKEVQNKYVHELLAPVKYRNAYLRGIAHYQKTGEGPVIGKTLPLEAITKDGRTITIELSVSSIVVNHQWQTIAIIRDITARKEEEIILERNRAVINATMEGIFMVDKNHNIVKINPAFTLITGYEESDVLGKNPSILSSGRHDKAFYQDMWHSILTKGMWVGEIWNRRKNGEIYPEWLSITALLSESGEVEQYVGIFSDFTVRAELEAEIARAANKDPLTNLYNRRAFTEQLSHAIDLCERNKSKSAVLFMDIDSFKPINDKRGHLIGDELLKQFSDRLNNCLRKTDFCARFGGDEFVVLLQDTKGNEEIAEVAEKIRQKMEVPFTIDGITEQISVSIGIAIYPDDAQDAEQLIKLSDETMYRVKQSTRNAFDFASSHQ